MTLNGIIIVHGTRKSKLVLNLIIEPPVLDKALLDCKTRTNRDPKTHFSEFSKLKAFLHFTVVYISCTLTITGVYYKRLLIFCKVDFLDRIRGKAYSPHKTQIFLNFLRSSTPKLLVFITQLWFKHTGT